MDTIIYLFDPCTLSDDELWELVNQYEEFQREGVIGDCRLREIAEKEEQYEGLVASLTIMRMAIIAHRSSTEILRRNFPHRFQDGQGSVCCSEGD
jgi:hypothetical protein